MTKVVEWFGYKLHLLVDAKHEVALAYHLADRRFHAHVGAVTIVHLAFATQFATQQQNEGSFGKMKL